MTAFFKLGTQDKLVLESVLTAANEVGEFRRARALLRPDEGMSVQDVAHLLRVSRRTIYNWISRFRSDKNISPVPQLGDAPRVVPVRRGELSTRLFTRFSIKIRVTLATVPPCGCRICLSDIFQRHTASEFLNAA
ncbi:Homeodomain-like domain-containing protein [Desulfonema magnum]|uniref:Homeodomain-like domain-containing protein n=2 Tax=Desulfonema magnum TaxID=45655 RepID=A0A975BWU3_9BACT|nr:Homeodomain-like domain-containing protein [Desulfonema magnum]